MNSKKIYVLQIGMTPNLGGIETYVMNLYRKIDRNKVQFDFVDWCGKEEIAFRDEIKKMGGRVFKIPSRKEDYLGNKRALNRLVASGKYSYTYSNLNSLSNILGITATYGVKTIPIIHAHNDNIEKRLFVAKLLDRLHKPYVNHKKCVRLACSQSAGEWMFPNRKFRIVADSIDTKAFKYSEKTRQADRHKLRLENKLVIGSVARFGPQKNLLFLIDVFHRMCETEKEVILMLVGTGVQETLLRQRVSQYGLGKKVLFLGARHDTADLMQAMDLMIAPSVFEGFGMSVLEAQCAGLPCYVSDAFHDEVIQTPIVKRLPLELGADKWSGQIISDLKLRNLGKRSSYSEVIKENGYDNTEVAAEFQARLLSGFKQFS